MKELFVETKTNKYPIYIKNDFEDLLKAFEDANLLGRKACIIADSNTDRLYLDTVKQKLGNSFLKVCSYTFEAGENSKNLGVISNFYEYFVKEQLDRKSVLIALGGGVVGDMTGFAAATFMRGVSFVQIPTTLLSQVDSSVGGKTGVDFMGNKNMVGAFYQPEFVYINTATLKTLPYREVAAGMAETIKYGFIIDKNYLTEIEDNKQKLKQLDAEAFKSIIYGACKSKAFVVGEDEKENGLRAILNFGHTFGHSVETLSDFKLLHGECVSIGMVAGLYFSYKRGNITKQELECAEKLLEYFELPIKAEGFDENKVFEQMYYDKKTKNGKINIVALEKIGKAYIECNATESEMREAIEYII